MKTIVSIVATLAVGIMAASAAPTAQLKLGSKKFGHGQQLQVTSPGVISASKLYKFKLDGACTGTGALAKLVPAGTTVSQFVDRISPGSSSVLSGYKTNPSGKLPIVFINKLISGTRNVPGVGKVTVKAKVVGGANAAGKVYLNITNITLTANGTPVPGFIKFDKGSSLTLEAAPTISLIAVKQSVAENAGSVKIVLYRSGSLNGTAAVNYATANGTASPEDYTPVSGTVTFANGQSEKTISVPIINNSIKDTARNFTFTISSPATGVLLGKKLTSTITIHNDD